MTKSTSTPMTIAESYAEGIVDLSLKLQKGNQNAHKAILPEDINEPVNLNILDIYGSEAVVNAIPEPLLDENDHVIPRPGDTVLTGDDYTAAVNAIRLQDKDTRDC